MARNPCPDRLGRPVAQLTPAEAWMKLRRARERVAALRDAELDDIFEWCLRLAAVQGYLRHDPNCAHHEPHKPGATRCTCGLEQLRRG